MSSNACEFSIPNHDSDIHPTLEDFEVFLKQYEEENALMEIDLAEACQFFLDADSDNTSMPSYSFQDNSEEDFETYLIHLEHELRTFVAIINPMPKKSMQIYNKIPIQFQHTPNNACQDFKQLEQALLSLATTIKVLKNQIKPGQNISQRVTKPTLQNEFKDLKHIAQHNNNHASGLTFFVPNIHKRKREQLPAALNILENNHSDQENLSPLKRKS